MSFFNNNVTTGGEKPVSAISVEQSGSSRLAQYVSSTSPSRDVRVLVAQRLTDTVKAMVSQGGVRPSGSLSSSSSSRAIATSASADPNPASRTYRFTTALPSTPADPKITRHATFSSHAGSFQPLSTELRRANTLPPNSIITSTTTSTATSSISSTSTSPLQAAKLDHLRQFVTSQLRSLGAKCEHVSSWKRLRAKKGRAYYACQQCGVRWSVPNSTTPGSSSRNSNTNTNTTASTASIMSCRSAVVPGVSAAAAAASSSVYPGELRSLMAMADTVHDEAQKILGVSVTSITETLLADDEDEDEDEEQEEEEEHVDIKYGAHGAVRQAQLEDITLGASTGSGCLTQGSGCGYSLTTLGSASFISSTATSTYSLARLGTPSFTSCADTNVVSGAVPESKTLNDNRGKQ